MFYSIDYLVLYKGSNERISSIVKRAIKDLWHLREDKIEVDRNVPEDQEDNFKSIVSLTNKRICLIGC